VNGIGNVDMPGLDPALTDAMWAARQRAMATSADAAGRSKADAEKVAKDFESILLHRLVESMRRTVAESELFDSGATRQLQGMFWDFLAREIANQGGLGLWRDIYR